MTIILFDVENTIVNAGENITESMIKILTNLSKNNTLGIIDDGTYTKIKIQLDPILNIFKYVFTESSNVVYIDNDLIFSQSMLDYCDKEILEILVRKCTNTILSHNKFPQGHILDYKTGSLHVSFVGIKADQKIINKFIENDKMYNIRYNLLESLKNIDIDNKFDIYLDGMCGICITPNGWNKLQSLKYFNDDEIWFFGNNTNEYDNNYPLFNNNKIKSVSVSCPNDTMDKINNLFFSTCVFV